MRHLAEQRAGSSAWYLKGMRVGGKDYAPNLTRWAKVFLDLEVTTKTAAEHVAEEVRTRLRQGTYVAVKDYRPPAAPAPSPVGLTLAALVAKFETLAIDADPEKAENSKTNDKANLKRLCRTRVEGAALGDRVMADITIGDLIAFRAAQEGIAASTWNKIRTTIGQLWSWARWTGHLERDVLVEAPRPALKRLRRGKAHQRKQRIDPRLWAEILEAATELRAQLGPRFVGLLVALMETGARLGELLALQWRDVNLAQRQLLIRAEETGAGKTGARPCDLSDVLVAVLEARQLDPAGQPYQRLHYVFGDAYGGRQKSIDKAWRTTLLRAYRIEPGWTPKGDYDARTRATLAQIDLHVHDIRHEAACRWLESKVWDLEQIRQRLGHATIAQTATYLHAGTGATRTAQREYDAQRQAAAAAAEAERAVQRTAAGSRRYKVGTNAPSDATRADGPRLVKSRKLQGNKVLAS